MIEEYLEKYPESKSDVMAAIYAFGEDETETILTEALEKGKRVIFEADKKALDKLTYRFD